MPHIEASVNYLLQHLKFLLAQGAQPPFRNWVGEMGNRIWYYGDSPNEKVLEKEGWAEGPNFGLPIIYEIGEHTPWD